MYVIFFSMRGKYNEAINIYILYILLVLLHSIFYDVIVPHFLLEFSLKLQGYCNEQKSSNILSLKNKLQAS